MKHKTTPTKGALVVATSGLWQYSVATIGDQAIYKGGIEALWYRREKGKLTVHIGEITGYQSEDSTSITEWLKGCSTPISLNRRSSFNGTTFRPRAVYEDAEPLEALHAALIEGRTDLPDGYQGWWKPSAVTPPSGFGHTPRTDDPTVALCGTGSLMVGVKATTDSGVSAPDCPVCETTAKALQDA